MTSVNSAAQALKAMHIPGSPIVFTNVWDALSLNAVLSLNEGSTKPVKAVATASSAVAASAGCEDEDLNFEQNITAIRHLARLCQQAGMPLSADLQDGYGTRIEEIVTAAVQAGVSGANIEDSIPSTAYGKGVAGSLYPLDEQVRRLKSALKAATVAGCADFVLNARCDIFCINDPNLDDDARIKEAIIRGKAFLDLGATTVFYWGGPRRGLAKAHLQTLVKELDGGVATLLSGYAGDPTVSELAQIGVARVSIGDDLYPVALSAIRNAASKIFLECRLST